jgi:hypothetical protein
MMTDFMCGTKANAKTQVAHGQRHEPFNVIQQELTHPPNRDIGK